MEALSCVDFVLEASAHNFFPDLFNALNKQALQIISLQFSVDFVRLDFLRLLLLISNSILKLPDHFTVACLNSLDVLDDSVSHIHRLLLRFKEISDKLLKL